MYAAQWGHTDCVQLLLQRGASTSSCDADEFTAVHHATANGHLEVLRLLLASTADTVALAPLFCLYLPPIIPEWTDSFSLALACGCRPASALSCD